MWMTTKDYALIVQIAAALVFAITALGTWLTGWRVFGYTMILSGIVVITAISVISNYGVGTG